MFCFSSGKGFHIFAGFFKDEYLVLDGYKPEPEKAEPEDTAESGLWKAMATPLPLARFTNLRADI